ncbi:MAG: V-type ATP synthase subunit D [Clostridia bacterium]|nr:V-type ATP synthase subunit D [Clostridia bacterium]
MAQLKVNPTRMELKRLKERLKTSARGYKLLKDKTDEMIRRFVVIARENKILREQVEQELGIALQGFVFSRAVSSNQVIDEAIIMPNRIIELQCNKRSIMNVAVPSIDIKEQSVAQDMYPYSFTSVTQELDNSVEILDKLLVKLIKLAEVEKTCNMLADEIEKNKRRVNALENVIIPQLEETIKFIKMKLDENERSATVRLMKVKTMLEQN